MRDVLDRVVEWLDAGRDVALATVVEVIRKAPREPGTTMAVSDRGEIAGSVSGGCVEPAVVEVAQEVLAAGRPRLVTFGISDDDAFEVGLSCGGTIRVWVEPARGPWPGLARRLQEALAAGKAVALARVLGAAAGDGAGARGAGPVPAGAVVLLEEAEPGGPARIMAGSSGDPGLDRELARRAGVLLARDETAREPLAGADVFIQPFAPPPVLYVIGAVHPAAALAEAGRFLGYRVVVCDPRSPFATSERIPAAHAIARQWPDEYLSGARITPRDAVCVLTHDLKFDVPALRVALRSPAGYIGVMGSRRTHERRLAALREAGVGDGDLKRLHAPIGLDIGARTPEEMAVAIMAEIIASRRTNRPQRPAAVPAAAGGGGDVAGGAA
ncbi:XdhC family protein [Thermaerobacter subterraneus]|uniref:Xanthine and CO dehydrogenases maturation factor, XdhC/CoxF family n=1 Tax=Thermaerobacter subterraneus DSM 13965 TaxID=867903 RepID=K6Q2S4_9FIRM|nr:XdhC/CoxI family protein [Thermaerobacter subterraneus]EKP95349.1 xanthine and CO dehydrogenases maturation factor, XdhC/CoxF family [Thermaerobacter subterraneus DSM 13965]